MRKNNSGFTLGEVLICMTIVGVIMALSVQTLKIIKTSYASLGYFVFNNTQTLTRELYAGNTAKDSPQDSSIMLCKKEDGTSTYVFKPDSEVEDTGTVKCNELPANTTGTNIICRKIVEMSNTSGKIDCDNLFTAEVSDGEKEPYISDFDSKNPNFITTNGFRYYLTKRTFNSSISNDFGFRLLAVDVNGTSKPNVIDPDDDKMPPDVLTFMIMDNGEMYPLGVAADNLKVAGNKTVQYLNPKVKGYYYSYNPERTEGIPQDCYVDTQNGKRQVCNYAVVYVQNDKGNTLFSYREAFCNSLGQNKQPAYADYCYGITGNELCPPSNSDKRFDMCQVELIKPMFRYNL